MGCWWLIEDKEFKESEGRKVRQWITVYCCVDGLFEIPNMPSLYVDCMPCLIVSQLAFFFETWHSSIRPSAHFSAYVVMIVFYYYR